MLSRVTHTDFSNKIVKNLAKFKTIYNTEKVQLTFKKKLTKGLSKSELKKRRRNLTFWRSSMTKVILLFWLIVWGKYSCTHREPLLTLIRSVIMKYIYMKPSYGPKLPNHLK